MRRMNHRLWVIAVRVITVLVIACLPPLARPSLSAELPTARDLFTSGKEGYKRYRIPALIVAPDNSLLAFCEGRADGGGLTGNIDLILKRSNDSGRTWGPVERIMDDGPNTLGNPCPVIDRSTGVIWLAYTRSLGTDLENEIVAGTSEERTRVLVTHSRDSGRTWADPIDLTSRLRRDDWAWYGTGPGVGIQLQDGRLVIPSYHSVLRSGDYESHTIYSDDHGESWRLGDTVRGNTSECQVAERRDGSVYLNARTLRDVHRRTVAESIDRGTSWQNARYESELYDAPCQAALYSLPKRGKSDKPVWLFSHPAGPTRINLTVRISHDEGKTWPVSRRIVAGSSGYSSLTLMPNGSIGCLFEVWRDRNNHIRFLQFSLD